MGSGIAAVPRKKTEMGEIDQKPVFSQRPGQRWSFFKDKKSIKAT